MTRSLFFGMIVLIAASLSCNNKANVPAGIIAVDKMTSILGDMMLADNYANEFIVLDSLQTRKEENAKFYAQIFSIYGTDRQQFVKSYKYYEGEPATLKLIYDSLYERMNRLRSTHYQNLIRKAGSNNNPK